MADDRVEALESLAGVAGAPEPVRYLEYTPGPALVLASTPPPYHAPVARRSRTGTTYSFKPASASGPTTCIGDYFVKDCPRGHERRVIYDGCRKGDCAKCEPGRSYRRAGDAWGKCMGKIDEPWGVFVFTCPVELHPLIDVKAARELEAEAWKILEAWLAEVNGVNPGWARDAGLEGGTFGAMSWIHPEGDEEPGLWRPHWNFIVPMVSAAGAQRLRFWWKDKAEFSRLSELLRAAWKEVLERRFGRLEGELNVFYEYRTREGKKRHALVYFGRRFPGWSKLRLAPKRWGFLSDRLMSEHRWDWVEVTAPPWGASGRCSTCGAELVDSGTCDEESARQIRQAQKDRRREAG